VDVKGYGKLRIDPKNIAQDGKTTMMHEKRCRSFEELHGLEKCLGRELCTKDKRKIRIGKDAS